MTTDLTTQIEAVLTGQLLGVLATSLEGHPYTTLVAFAVSSDLREICFATTRATRKFANLSRDDRVSLLIDNRRNRPEDFRAATAVTAIGRAREIEPDRRSEWQKLYLDRHASLREFVSAPHCALFVISVDRYALVDHFQNVYELEL